MRETRLSGSVGGGYQASAVAHAGTSYPELRTIYFRGKRGRIVILDFGKKPTHRERKKWGQA